MRKFALALTAASLMLGMSALAASAQTQQPGAADLNAQLHNFSPMVKQTACNGRWGPWCPPGRVRRCWRGPYGARHCACVRCY
jgi:Spy/CpxP family protein refolding chaperone